MMEEVLKRFCQYSVFISRLILEILAEIYELSAILDKFLSSLHS